MAKEREPGDTPLHLIGCPKDFYIEIERDDGGHAIIVARLNSFAAACGAYGRLVEDRPADFTCSPFFSR